MYFLFLLLIIPKDIHAIVVNKINSSIHSNKTVLSLPNILNIIN